MHFVLVSHACRVGLSGEQGVNMTMPILPEAAHKAFASLTVGYCCSHGLFTQNETVPHALRYVRQAWAVALGVLSPSEGTTSAEFIAQMNALPDFFYL